MPLLLNVPGSTTMPNNILYYNFIPILKVGWRKVRDICYQFYFFIKVSQHGFIYVLFLDDLVIWSVCCKWTICSNMTPLIFVIYSKFRALRVATIHILKWHLTRLCITTIHPIVMLFGDCIYLRYLSYNYCLYFLLVLN